jgi:hypothetical protein
MGSMVFDVKPMVFPSRKVGGEFVCEVFVTGPLTQLDAGAPYNGKVLGGGLWFDTEEEVEKIPERFLEVGCGLIRKRKRKRSQWGSIPRKAS